MTRSTFINLVLLILSLAAFAHCDDSPDGDGDADSDSDGDGDADGDGDGDGDSDAGPPDCPRNSGWPCTCDVEATCDDGTRCVYPPNTTDGLGLCTAECDPDAPPASTCPATVFPGTMGLCWLADRPNTNPTHCLLGCTPGSPNCPSDQRCVDLGIMPELDFCIP